MSDQLVSQCLYKLCGFVGVSVEHFAVDRTSDGDKGLMNGDALFVSYGPDDKQFVAIYVALSGWFL